MNGLPRTLMSTEEAQDFCNILRTMPQNTGMALTRCMEPVHTPPVFNAYHAIIALPVQGGRGEAYGDNPAIAIRTAWARAHANAALALEPKS